VLEAPRLGCLNVHGSLLPRWRGAAPIQRSILAGDTQTGITIMQMDVGLDTGAMLLKEAVAIAPATTASSLHDELAALGARMIVEALEGLAAGRLRAEPQPEDGVTYAAKLTREDGRLDWTQPAAFVERQVRALTPWPGCWFDAPKAGGTERIKVLTAEPAPEAKVAIPGTVLDDRLTIACADGAVRLTGVQRPGKGPVDGAAFLRGFDLAPGSRLDPTS
jgi:methionyl-tRNA formyltransferase